MTLQVTTPTLQSTLVESISKVNFSSELHLYSNRIDSRQPSNLYTSWAIHTALSITDRHFLGNQTLALHPARDIALRSRQQHKFTHNT